MIALSLSKGKVAVIDDDMAHLAQVKWSASRGRRTWYAKRMRPDGHMEYLHHAVMGMRGVDHRDGDGLNNLNGNLRPATPAQNSANSRKKMTSATSRFKGVCFHRGAQKWMASITVAGRAIYLGLHAVEEDAAEAYATAAREHFGEYARVG